ncbi:amino acid transporter [Elysia marginata]|uniref:Amino acid transporter n=1 Tax=Elysia marginata TaxID=1093978 RepID=A0AAV4JB86_9GAST|nr:amino acid transporter [Elysia marginata]
MSTRLRGIQAALAPLVSIFTAFINLYLMASLRLAAWGFFLIWMVLGLLIYYLYGKKPAWLGWIRRKSSHDEKVGLLEEHSEKEKSITFQEESLLIGP